MPIYEYRCQDCGHEFEAMQKMSEARLTDCPECGKAGLKKLISVVGFKLKGTGWYETDFKNSGKPEKKEKTDKKEKKEKTTSTSEPKKSGGNVGSDAGHSH